jgi:hypothetical protein
MKDISDFNSALTLGEALQKMRDSESEGNLENKMAGIAQLLEQHDAVHIVFNCGTSIQDEIAVHLWMVLATTANLSDMHRAVASQEHRTVLSGIGHLKLIGIWLTSLPRFGGIMIKSLRMKKRLVMEEISQLKAHSILEIRRSHGIVL